MKKLLTIFLFFPLGLSATTYYVRTDGHNAASGLNNTNNGTTGAWLTVTYAAAHTTSGDLIIIQPGTYIEAAATIALPVGVSLEGTDSATCIIKSLLTADYTEIFSLRSSEGTNGNQHISNLKFDGQNLSTSWAILIYGRSNVSINNCTIVNFNDRGVIFSGRNDNVDGAPTIYATGNTVYNCRIENCARYEGGFGRGCLCIGGQGGMLIHHNYLSQNSRPTGQNGWPLKLWDNGYLKGLKIYNNTFRKIPFQGNSGGDGGWDFCMELWFIEGGLEIYSNNFQGGLDLVQVRKRGYSYGAYIHDNTFAQDTPNVKVENAIDFEIGAESVTIENNIFRNVTQGAMFQIEFFPGSTDGGEPISIIHDIIVRKNLFDSLTGGTGFAVGIPQPNNTTAQFSIKNFNVINNTIIANPVDPPHNGIVFNLDSNTSGPVRNININNNIVQGFNIEWMRVRSINQVMDTFNTLNNDKYSNGNSNNTNFTHISPSHYTNTGNITGNPLTTGAFKTLGGGSAATGNATDGGDIGWTGGNDTIPPSIIATNPASSASGVLLDASFVVTFDGPMNAAYLTGANLYLTYSGGTVAATVIPGVDYAIITPRFRYAPLTLFTFHAENLKDAAGNTQAAPYTSTFTTSTETRAKRKMK